MTSEARAGQDGARWAGPGHTALAALLEGATVRVACEGGSMFPVIRHGDVVEVEPLRDDPAVGDVCLAWVVGPTGRVWALHRLIGTRGDMFLLRGDNALREDPPVRRVQLVGRATRVVGPGSARALRWSPTATSAWLRAAPVVARAGAAGEQAARLLRGVSRAVGLGGR